MAITTAHDAPASTPSSPGSASGLRVWPCIRAPATPSAMPTAMASTVRGTRSACTIVAASDPSSWNSTSTTVPSGIGAAAQRQAQQRRGAERQDQERPAPGPSRGVPPAAPAPAGCSTMLVDMEG